MRKYFNKYVVAPTVAVASSATVAMADTATAINNAYDSASTSLGLTVDGMIGMVAVVTGVGIIISMLRR